MTIRQIPPTVAEDPLETRLRAALRAQATQSVPDPRYPPLIEWPESATRRAPRPPWLMPLVAAASVVAITAGIVAMQTWGRTGAQAPAASTAPSVAPTSPPSAPSASTLPTGTSASTPATTAVHQLLGVRVALPTGWVVKDLVLPGGSSPIGTTVCLGPGVECVVTLARLEPTRNPVDVETEGGYLSNPAYCDAADGPQKRVLNEAADVALGGRTADYRFWTWTCGDRKVHDIAQYVVAAPVGYILSSEKADAGTRAAMTFIAANSVLPPAEPGGVRLYDQGLVRSIVAAGDGYDLSIDRTVGSSVNEWTNSNPATYAYHLSTSALPQGAPVPAKGSPVQLFSDGVKVTQLVIPGG